ncbi:MAG: helix-turn-helix domain-containing protein [Chloroflexi bacterium]|nr:MAG: helix-turn-helix domain-containing protein [Chloroflexota bacterium]
MTTRMKEYAARLMQAVNFMETNLARAITLGEISGAAHMSSYHFLRLFHASIGETPGAYVRKRRLSEAAGLLVSTDRRIIEIAFDFRFESQAAFTRAFRRQFRVTPAAMRRSGKLVRPGLFEPLRQADIEHRMSGGLSQEPRFVERPETTLVGMRCANTAHHIWIPALWGRFMKRRRTIPNAVDGTTYGVYIYDALPESDITDEMAFDYLAAIEVSCSENGQPVVPTGMVSRKIPGGYYAIFTHRGFLRDLNKTYEYIYKTWLPGSRKAEFIQNEFFEYHGREFMGDREDSITEIYIPVRIPGG